MGAKERGFSLHCSQGNSSCGMAVVAARRQKQREGWGHMYHCPSHLEGHFGSFSYPTLQKGCREMGRRAVFCFLWGRKAISSLATGYKVLQAMPYPNLPSSTPTPKTHKHWPSHSCTCGQVSYEHQCIYTCSFMEERKLGWEESQGRGFMLKHGDHALPTENC